MRKKFLGLTLSLALILSLTACGGKTPATNSDTSTTTQTNSKNGDTTSNVLYEPDTKNVKVTAADYHKADMSQVVRHGVSDEDVKQQVASVLDYFKEAEYLSEGTVEDGSIAYVSFDGYVDCTDDAYKNKDCEPDENASSVGYEISIGSNTMIEGFESGLIGHKVGENVELHLQFPTDYYNADYAGKSVIFNVKILNLVAYSIPTWDDDFVKQNLEFASTDEYEEFLKEDMTSYYNSAYIQNANDTMINYLVDNSTVEGIDEDVEKYYQDELETHQDIAGQQGFESIEDYATKYLGYSGYDAFDEDLKETAERDVKYKYIMLQIAKEQGFVLTQDIYDNFLNQMAVYYGSTKEEVKTSLEGSGVTETYENALVKYTLDYILDDMGYDVSAYTNNIVNGVQNSTEE